MFPLRKSWQSILRSLNWTIWTQLRLFNWLIRDWLSLLFSSFGLFLLEQSEQGFQQIATWSRTASLYQVLRTSSSKTNDANVNGQFFLNTTAELMLPKNTVGTWQQRGLSHPKYVWHAWMHSSKCWRKSVWSSLVMPCNACINKNPMTSQNNLKKPPSKWSPVMPLQLADPGLTQPSLLELLAVPAGTKASTDYSLQPPTADAYLPTCFHMFPPNPSLSHVADLMDSFWWIEQVMLLDNKDDYLLSKKMSSNNIPPSGSWALSCLLKWLIRNWLSFLFWNFRLLLVEKNDGRKWMK